MGSPTASVFRPSIGPSPARSGRSPASALGLARVTISHMASFHESVEFTSPSALSDDLRDDAFRCGTFDGLDVEGPGFEGICGCCTFKNSAWYLRLVVL